MHRSKPIKEDAILLTEICAKSYSIMLYLIYESGNVRLHKFRLIIYLINYYKRREPDIAINSHRFSYKS